MCHARVFDVVPDCRLCFWSRVGCGAAFAKACEPMSGEAISQSPTLVQSLITSYYCVKDPPLLVQQRITQYFPACECVNEESESVGQGFTACSCYSPTEDVASSSDVAATPTSRRGDIGWYLHTSNQVLQARERLVQNPRSLFGALVTGDGLSRDEHTSHPVLRSPCPSVSSYFRFFFLQVILSSDYVCPLLCHVVSRHLYYMFAFDPGRRFRAMVLADTRSQTVLVPL